LKDPNGTTLCDIDGLLKAKNEKKFYLVEAKMTVEVITAFLKCFCSSLTLSCWCWFAGVSHLDSHRQPAAVYDLHEAAAERSDGL
jgi:hypothetical protein